MPSRTPKVDGVMIKATLTQSLAMDLLRWRKDVRWPKALSMNERGIVSMSVRSYKHSDGTG